MSLQTQLSNWYSNKIVEFDKLLTTQGLSKLDGFIVRSGPPLQVLYNKRKNKLSTHLAAGYTYVSHIDKYDTSLRHTHHHKNLINNMRLYVPKGGIDDTIPIPTIMAEVWSSGNESVIIDSVNCMKNSAYSMLYYMAKKPVSVFGYRLILNNGDRTYNHLIAIRIINDALLTCDDNECVAALSLAAPHVIQLPTEYTTSQLINFIRLRANNANLLISNILSHVIDCKLLHIIIQLNNALINRRLCNFIH